MKEVNKIYKIYQGFFGDKLPKEITTERREKCNTCPFNSKNAEELNTFEEIRNSMTGNFCTICKCQIKEKTQSPHEECALYMINREKKWFRIKLETMEKETLNVTQVGKNIFDLTLDKDEFTLNLGKVRENSQTVANLMFDTDVPIEWVNTVVSCGCVATETKSFDGKIVIDTFINLNSVGYGSGVKTLELIYKVNGVQKKQTIKFKFFRTV